MYRLMVRSREGHYFYNMGWYQKFVWSTWSTFTSIIEATTMQYDLSLGGVTAKVIDEEMYPFFCSSHSIG